MSLMKLPFQFDEHRRHEKNRIMKKKLLIGAAVAAALLSGGGVAAADPSPEPAPAPEPAPGPLCWTSTPDGWAHTQYVPCGWTYSQAGGWQQLPGPHP
jgi:hypothetical protein